MAAGSGTSAADASSRPSGRRFKITQEGVVAAIAVVLFIVFRQVF